MMKHFRRYWIVPLGAITLIIGLLSMPGRAQSQVYAQAQPTPALSSASLRTITVSGSGSAEMTPDIANVVLGVQTQAQTASQALTQNSTQMQSVMSTLQKAGVASADIQTTQVQLTPQYENAPQPNQGTATNRLTGYIATNTVQVKVRKLDGLGALLDQVVAAGGNQIQGISFDVSDPSQATDQARKAAMNNATHKAQQLASLANATLGPVFSINETSQAPIPFAAMMQSQGAAANVPVSPGTQTITVNLQVTWQIQTP